MHDATEVLNNAIDRGHQQTEAVGSSLSSIRDSSEDSIRVSREASTTTASLRELSANLSTCVDFFKVEDTPDVRH